jgi:2-oxo-4-hydroxy-4-carboxy-5-ureidoimidazoline decarboxylase
MNSVLDRWNGLPDHEAAAEIFPCCGSRRWAERLAGRRPFADADALFTASDAVWAQLDPADWDEAFACHPRIGEKKAPGSATARSAEWSSREQSGVATAGVDIQERLKRANAAYEDRFGRTYIVCASGKSAAEMLAILERRMSNDDAAELREAAEQQRQITQLRLRKWLQT